MTYKKKPTNLNELRKRVESYFKSRLVPMTDKNGVPICDENGKVIEKTGLPYTLTGLALAIGCETRDELFTFENEEMQRFIRMSVLKVEEYAEERLFSKEAFSGVKLFLATNFDRWREGAEKIGDDDDYVIPDGYNRWTV